MRRLDAKEIQVRIDRFAGGQGGKPTMGFLFLYIDARTAQQMMDDEFGPTNWKVDYQFGQNSAICNISVYDENKKEWITRQDVGGAANVNSTADSTKSMISDAFKRACVAWGIGRELYLGPKVKFDTTYVNLREYNGKWQTYDDFVCRGVDYDEHGHITALSIFDASTGHSIFEYDVRPNELTAEEVKKCEEVFKTRNIDIKRTVEVFGLKEFKDITRKQVKDIMANPSILEPKGEEAVAALPNTQKGMPAQNNENKVDIKDDFLEIDDVVEEDSLPFK